MIQPEPEEKPAVFDSLKDLMGDVKSPEDKALLDDWHREAIKERSEAIENLGHEAVSFTVNADGSTVPTEQAQQAVANQEDRSHPYGEAGRRA